MKLRLPIQTTWITVRQLEGPELTSKDTSKTFGILLNESLNHGSMRRVKEMLIARRRRMLVCIKGFTSKHCLSRRSRKEMAVIILSLLRKGSM